MRQIESVQAIKFDEGKWRVSYGMPAYGKDFWGRRADEREQREKKTKDEARKSTIKKSFSLKRKSARMSVKSPRSPRLPDVVGDDDQSWRRD
jgi:hypothetical protein